MLECCRQDMKEEMICINNKYGLIKLRDLYQINHHLHLYTKTSCVIDDIELGSSAVAFIAHFDARYSIIILEFGVNLSKILC